MPETLCTPLTKVHARDNSAVLTGRISTRDAVRADLDTLVDIDIRSFSSVYKGYEQSERELRAELTCKFNNRFDLVGGKWIKVAEREGQLVGFIMACPTSKDPQYFTSWEDSTDNGTLNSTHDPQGKNLYVISLSMLKSGSVDLGQNMLFGKVFSEMLKDGIKQAYFASRVPGLKDWVLKQCGITGMAFDTLAKEELDSLAKEYFSLKKEKNGKMVPKDRLLEIYDSAGCEFVDIYADGYKDEPSLNYSVLGVFKNPLSERLRKSRFVRYVAAFLIRQASKSNYLMAKFF